MRMEPALRDAVKETQINLAKRNGSLIIDTYTLLRLLEKYRSGEFTRADVISVLKERTGILTLE